MSNLLALDIGGANLKSANGAGYASVRRFALWRSPGDLAGALSGLIAEAPASDRLVATMTGELCDCFETKAAGVRSILDALESASERRSVLVYLTDGRFTAPDEARELPLLAAASNWHALASFAARFTGGRPAVLIDIGSTTTDIIPILDGRPAASGRTDPERLCNGELAYTGVERTPIAAAVSSLPWRGRQCPVAAELFATTADAYLLLGDLPEDPSDLETADGRPSTRLAAHGRLSRMICADSTIMTETEAVTAARAVRESQVGALSQALSQVIRQMPLKPQCMIVSGHGEFLGRRLLEKIEPDMSRVEVVYLSEVLGARLSRVAPAHALAVLARDVRR